MACNKLDLLLFIVKKTTQDVLGHPFRQLRGQNKGGKRGHQRSRSFWIGGRLGGRRGTVVLPAGQENARREIVSGSDEVSPTVLPHVQDILVVFLRVLRSLKLPGHDPF